MARNAECVNWQRVGRKDCLLKELVPFNEANYFSLEGRRRWPEGRWGWMRLHPSQAQGINSVDRLPLDIELQGIVVPKPPGR